MNIKSVYCVRVGPNTGFQKLKHWKAVFLLRPLTYAHDFLKRPASASLESAGCSFSNCMSSCYSHPANSLQDTHNVWAAVAMRLVFTKPHYYSVPGMLAIERISLDWTRSNRPEGQFCGRGSTMNHQSFPSTSPSTWSVFTPPTPTKASYRAPLESRNGVE